MRKQALNKERGKKNRSLKPTFIKIAAYIKASECIWNANYVKQQRQRVKPISIHAHVSKHDLELM